MYEYSSHHTEDYYQHSSQIAEDEDMTHDSVLAWVSATERHAITYEGDYHYSFKGLPVEDVFELKLFIEIGLHCCHNWQKWKHI